MRAGAGVLLVLLVGVACGGVNPDAPGAGSIASTTTPRAENRGTAPDCVSDSGVAFTTALESCDQAVEDGRYVAFALGLAANSGDGAADSAFAEICAAIQGGPMIEATSQIVDMARLMDARGICPGDVDLLEQPPP